MRIAAIFVLILLSSAQSRAAEMTRLADCQGWFGDATCVFEALGHRFTLNAQGHGCRYRSEALCESFDLLQRQHVQMGQLSFIEYQSDLLLITKCSYGDGGFTRVLRLDGENLRVMWSVHISAFNASRGLVEESSVYLSAIGFIGKLDLESGHFLWQHDDLYERATGCFNSFNSPELIGSMVVFTESSHRRHGGDERRQIRVDRKTGEIISR